MAYNYDEIEALANSAYGQEDRKDRIFSLLVDVADCYVSLLEEEASDDPAPYFLQSTPMEATMNGLKENLDMKRSGELPQHR